MSLFDRFRNRKPTTEQVDRLSSTTNLDAPDDTAPGAAARADVGPDLLDFVFQSMRIDEAWSVREPRAFTWWGHRLAQRVRAEPARKSEGFAVVRLGAETDLLRDVPNTRDLAGRLAALNRYASMSAFVWDPERASITLKCAAYAHPGTTGWLKLLFAAACALQAADSHIKADGLAQLLGGRPAVSHHPASGPRPRPDDMLFVIEQVFAPAGARPAPYSKRDFAAAARSSVVPWLRSEADKLSLRGVLRSPDSRGGTGVLTMSAEPRHPQLGSGLLSVLSIPYELDPALLLALSHELNLAEATTASARSHFLGAWCPAPEPSRALAFASFIPSAACRPALIEAMALSMAARAAWATSLIEAARAELEAAGEKPGEQAMPRNVLMRAIARTLEWEASAALEELRRPHDTPGRAPSGDGPAGRADAARQ
jgi:hypothetical protein